MKHFSDCPHETYEICTCDMRGEEIALIEWKIKQQEGKLKWYNFVAHLSLMGSSDIPKKGEV